MNPNAAKSIKPVTWGLLRPTYYMSVVLGAWLFLASTVGASEDKTSNLDKAKSTRPVACRESRNRGCADRYSNAEIDARLDAMSNHLNSELPYYRRLHEKLAKVDGQIESIRSDLLDKALTTGRTQGNVSGFQWSNFFSILFGGFIVGLASVFQNLGRGRREGLFKCLESYWQVMKFRAEAEEKLTYEKYYDYYRALFDLQWSEYQLWKRYSLPTSAYREWIKQRRRDYNKPAVQRQRRDTNTMENISYKMVWDDLIKDSYYDAKDPFIAHLEKIHDNRLPIEALLRDRKLWNFWA